MDWKKMPLLVSFSLPPIAPGKDYLFLVYFVFLILGLSYPPSRSKPRQARPATGHRPEVSDHVFFVLRYCRGADVLVLLPLLVYILPNSSEQHHSRSPPEK